MAKSKTTIKSWSTELNDATKNYQKNRMYYGASNSDIKIIHVIADKTYSIEVPKNFKTAKLVELFDTLFGVTVTSNTISHRN